VTNNHVQRRLAADVVMLENEPAFPRFLEELTSFLRE
jgi:hypothetical protein